MGGREKHILLDSKKFILANPADGHQHSAVVPFARRLGMGQAKYSDYDKWAVRAFVDTHVGRGEQFDSGIDGRFFDSKNVTTRHKGICCLGPRAVYVRLKDKQTGDRCYSGFIERLDPNARWDSFPLGRMMVPASWTALAQSITTKSGITCDGADINIGIITKRVPCPTPPDLTVSLYSDAAGLPGTLLRSKTFTGTELLALLGPTLVGYVKATWTGCPLAASTPYWVVISVSTLSSVIWYTVLYDTACSYAEGVGKKATALGETWQDLGGDIFAVIEGTITDPVDEVACDLDGIVADILDFTDQGATKLYVLAGKKVYSLDTSDMTLVDENAGLTGDGICMKVYKDILYVSQGDSGAVRKKSGGSWGDVTEAWKARYMEVAPNLDGDMALWISGTAGAEQMSVRSTLDGSTFSSFIECDRKSPLLYIGYYSGEVWVASWHEIGVIDRSTSKYLPTFLFPSQRDPNNFKGSCVWHKNDLMLNIRHSVWHWNMGSQFRNIGPTQGVGFPKDRQGIIGHMLPLVNRLIVAIDGGDANFSSIYSYNGIGDTGWHEEYRVPSKGERIRRLFYTPVAGFPGMPSRLWFGCGKSLAYIPLPDSGDDPVEWSGSPAYEMQGVVLYPWVDYGLREVDKDHDSITIGCWDIDDDTFLDILYRTLLASDVWAEGGWTLLGTIGSQAQVAAERADVYPIDNKAKLSFPAGSVSRMIQIAIAPRTQVYTKTPKWDVVKLKSFPEPERVDAWTLVINCIDWEDSETGALRAWVTQQSELWEIFNKKEPFPFTDIYGVSWTVKMDLPPRETPLIRAATDEPTGCRMIVHLIEV